MINVDTTELSKDYISVFNHTLMKTLVITATSILVLVLIGITLFISVQGIKYFMPQKVLQITTTFQTQPYGSDSGYEAKSLSKNEFVLSHESKETLTLNLQQKLKDQFLFSNQAQPKVEVAYADGVYLLSTNSGQRILGEFISITENQNVYYNLSLLEDLRATVARLQQNLSDIQIEQLQPLHQEIYLLNQQDVDQSTPLYQKKLAEFTRWQLNANDIAEQIQNYSIQLKMSNSEILSFSINQMQDIYRPNSLSTLQSIQYFFNQIYLFLTDFPKQASSTGGVFPAIFGTLLMVIIMAVLVTPFGAIAAVYLHEYAPSNRLTSVIRVSVSNMAAVPSVVYGVFGLGFFVYVLGGSIDNLLFSSTLPSPTFGTPGLLWASLTMGILTLPVVIVATEEGLNRIPNNLRTGALALGATKYEMIKKIVLPMASPGILTGVILAIARAAGEVAPLILVGAVKFAPTLPVDSEFPFIHLERQFMHLGVFIYDGAFHNQTESQVASLMFATCLLLLIIVLLLNITAIVLRNRLRRQYEQFE